MLGVVQLIRSARDARLIHPNTSDVHGLELRSLLYPIPGEIEH